MSWTSAASDLRTMLSDNDKDKHCYRKKLLGETNGVNLRFKTFEFRRINDFKEANNTLPTYTAPPLGVFKNGILLTQADINSDNPETGDFILNVAPVDGDMMEASYYAQWFKDTEINQFLRLACNWMSYGDDFSQLPEGLRPSTLKYAQSEAYEKLAMRWSQMLSEQYIMQDAVEKDRFDIVKNFMDAAAASKKEAYKARDDFYSRSGQSNIPYASSIQGRVSNPVPRR